jgi:hypothetical protein
MIELERRTTLPADEVWRRITTWERHEAVMPLTHVRRASGPVEGVGSCFVARTSLGPLGFDDVMEVTAWQPPNGQLDGHVRVEKRGDFIGGWTEITVRPDDPGSVVAWREEAVLPWLGPLRALPAQVVGRLLFGRLVDRLLAMP